MNKFLEISKSWIAAADPNPQQQYIAYQRIQVCNTCEFRKHEEVLDVYYCGVCNCPLRGKVYSPVFRSCPKNKWPV